MTPFEPHHRSVRAKSRTRERRREASQAGSLSFARRSVSTSLDTNGWRGHGLLLAIVLAIASPAFAQSNLPPAAYANTQLRDPDQEAQAKALMETLRCIVCQGQSIADSDAEMAGDMRALVRRRIEAGEDPESIRTWLIERYGNWVSYAPPLAPVTWPLWAMPLLLLLGGLSLARGRFRRKRRG